MHDLYKCLVCVYFFLSRSLSLFRPPSLHAQLCIHSEFAVDGNNGDDVSTDGSYQLHVYVCSSESVQFFRSKRRRFIHIFCFSRTLACVRFPCSSAELLSVLCAAAAATATAADGAVLLDTFGKRMFHWFNARRVSFFRRLS